ncbi:hypothetical protein ACFLX7_03840 [Chloroflexota bacterium]
MDGYVIGIAVGLGVGIAIGISIGRKQKPWSELDAREKKVRIGTITAFSVLAATGAVVFLIRLLS